MGIDASCTISNTGRGPAIPYVAAYLPNASVRLFLLSLILAATSVSAQTTFAVTTVTKTAAHPYFGQGHPMGYAIDGVEGAEITLRRGQTVTFQLAGVEGFHPFYLTTSASGGGAGAFTTGVTGAPASGNAAVTFTVPMTAPDALRYQCNTHQFMGFRIVIVNATSAEGGPDGYALRLRSQNPGRGAVLRHPPVDGRGDSRGVRL